MRLKAARPHVSFLPDPGVADFSCFPWNLPFVEELERAGCPRLICASSVGFEKLCALDRTARLSR